MRTAEDIRRALDRVRVFHQLVRHEESDLGHDYVAPAPLPLPALLPPNTKSQDERQVLKQELLRLGRLVHDDLFNVGTDLDAPGSPGAVPENIVSRYRRLLEMRGRQPRGLRGRPSPEFEYETFHCLMRALDEGTTLLEEELYRLRTPQQPRAASRRSKAPTKRNLAKPGRDALPVSRMNVFISWSGETSKEIAQALGDWLPTVLPFAEPWLSAEHIEPGERWSDAIAAQLGATDYGLVVIVPENLHAEWIHFEAGAIAKSVKKGRLVPLLFLGVTPGELPSTLKQFQGLTYSEQSLKKLAQSINQQPEVESVRINADLLATRFATAWPDVSSRINAIVAKTAATGAGASRSTPATRQPAEAAPSQNVNMRGARIGRDVNIKQRHQLRDDHK